MNEAGQIEGFFKGLGNGLVDRMGKVQTWERAINASLEEIIGHTDINAEIVTRSGAVYRIWWTTLGSFEVHRYPYPGQSKGRTAWTIPATVRVFVDMDGTTTWGNTGWISNRPTRVSVIRGGSEVLWSVEYPA